MNRRFDKDYTMEDDMIRTLREALLKKYPDVYKKKKSTAK